MSGPLLGFWTASLEDTRPISRNSHQLTPGGFLPVQFHRNSQLADSEPFIVNEEEELSPELKEFIDQLIVPLLVELVMNGHLYSAEAPRYDDDTESLAKVA